MGKPGRPNIHVTVTYPKHFFDKQPPELCQFVELDGFFEEWTEAGYTDDDLVALSLELTINPKKGVVIPGAGGLRKLRLRAPGGTKGKRGGGRLCYAFYESVNVIALALVYGKGERADISPAQKRFLRDYLRRDEKVFNSRMVR